MPTTQTVLLNIARLSTYETLLKEILDLDNAPYGFTIKDVDGLVSIDVMPDDVTAALVTVRDIEEQSEVRDRSEATRGRRDLDRYTFGIDRRERTNTERGSKR